MATVNLALRFILELVGIAAVAYWGYRTPSATAAKTALAILAPLGLIVVWAFVVAPGADNPLSQTTRMLIGSVLLLATAGALALAGRVNLGVIVAVLIVLNTILMLLFPETA